MSGHHHGHHHHRLGWMGTSAMGVVAVFGSVVWLWCVIFPETCAQKYTETECTFVEVREHIYHGFVLDVQCSDGSKGTITDMDVIVRMLNERRDAIKCRRNQRRGYLLCDEENQKNSDH